MLHKEFVLRICVFSGSNPGRKPEYVEAARELGKVLAQAGIGIVYGGASVGLMGAVADAAMANGGEVIGIIPKALVDKEIAHTGLSDLRVVGSMHERKALMAELSDAFVALPGGLGTLEELFEVWTWGQLGYHAKPFAVYNLGGFYDGLYAWLDHVVGEQFMKPEHRDMLIVESEPQALLKAIDEYEEPKGIVKWVERENL